MFTKRQLDGWRGYWALATSGNCCVDVLSGGDLLGAGLAARDGGGTRHD